MPFGAHETLEVHEILNEKVNMMNHFGLYATQAQSPQVSQMIDRHLQSAMVSYDQLVNYTHDYVEPQTSNKMHHVTETPVQQIQYGLNQPSPVSPQGGAEFNDQQILAAMLSCHKNSAKNHMAKALECADPNLRQMLVNGAVQCTDQAYEVFLFMNEQGQYQVPTMKDHTAKTYLHTFQPSNQAGMMSGTAQTQGQNQGQSGYSAAQGYSQGMSGMSNMGSNSRPPTINERIQQSRDSFLRGGSPGMVEAVDHALLNQQVLNTQNQIQSQPKNH
ncbi:spore coat protein [Paenibacillus gansuensis]|uniref:Spore coat protein n=1 Tax=Paenibacillus gansuensis TaxID=306542 RepID=A0ABW5PD44_9BACL